MYTREPGYWAGVNSSSRENIESQKSHTIRDIFVNGLRRITASTRGDNALKVAEQYSDLDIYDRGRKYLEASNNFMAAGRMKDASHVTKLAISDIYFCSLQDGYKSQFVALHSAYSNLAVISVYLHEPKEALGALQSAFSVGEDISRRFEDDSFLQIMTLPGESK